MKRLALILSTLLIICVCAGCSDSVDPVKPGSVLVTVLDATDNTPLTNVTISSTPPTSVAQTDASGKVTLSGVASGTYSIMASKAGYRDQAVSVTVTANQQVTATILMTKGAQMPTAGLIAYYPFDGNANDGTVYANHGTVMGAQLSADRHGASGKSYHFNGTSQYIDCGSVANLNPLLTNAISISVWVRFDGLAGNQFILGKWGMGGPSAVSYHIGKDNTNRLVFNLNNTGLTEVISTYPLSTGTWYHLVAKAGGDGIILYLNGTVIGQSNGRLTFINPGTQPFRIGFETSSNAYFNGSIDDIRIYNRVLTDTEIATLFQE